MNRFCVRFLKSQVSGARDWCNRGRVFAHISHSPFGSDKLHRPCFSLGKPSYGCALCWASTRAMIASFGSSSSRASSMASPDTPAAAARFRSSGILSCCSSAFRARCVAPLRASASAFVRLALLSNAIIAFFGSSESRASCRVRHTRED